MRILKWIAERCDGHISARSTAFGFTPEPAALDRDGLDVPADRLEQVLTGNPAALLRQAEGARKFLSKFGDCLPAALLAEHRSLVRRLQESLH